jgi:hypothetical protein
MTRRQHDLVDQVEAHLARLGNAYLTAIVRTHMQDQLRQRGYNLGFEAELYGLLTLPVSATTTIGEAA